MWWLFPAITVAYFKNGLTTIMVVIPWIVQLLTCILFARTRKVSNKHLRIGIFLVCLLASVVMLVYPALLMAYFSSLFQPGPMFGESNGRLLH
jgi:hypothetical protein